MHPNQYLVVGKLTGRNEYILGRHFSYQKIKRVDYKKLELPQESHARRRKSWVIFQQLQPHKDKDGSLVDRATP